MKDVFNVYKKYAKLHCSDTGQGCVLFTLNRFICTG